MSWIQTYTGVKFDPANPDVHAIHFKDIAHSLSLLCRYNGHCLTFFSVAQHSTIMVSKVSEENKKWALLHDAAEIYMSDLPRPIKDAMPEFRIIENEILALIVERFDLSWPMPEEVKEADRRMLMTERRDLMFQTPDLWSVDAEPYPDRIIPVDWLSAKTEYVNYAVKLGLI